MTQLHSFNSGEELAKLVLSSDLLPLSCSKILQLRGEINQKEPLTYKVYQEPKATIIAFVASPTVTNQLLQEKEMVSSSSLDPVLQFLGTKINPTFGINKAAVTLFKDFQIQLSQLKEEHGDLTSPLIIAGHSAGASIAILFTLWLLKDINLPGTKRYRPLCITFGAPFIGDEALQKAMSHNPLANSCFLHVAANLDSVPRLFLPRPTSNPNLMDIDCQTGTYSPFGTFLLCSDAGYACGEDPEQVSDLLEAMGLETVGSQWQMEDYKRIVDRLMSIVLIKGTSQFGEVIGDPLRAGIVLQLQAIGIQRSQPNLIAKIEERKRAWSQRKMLAFDPSKKLNDIKIYMAYMEWYKKSCKSAGKGYYDGYRDGKLQQDMNVVKFKKYLTNYWEEMVAEAEKKPQTEEAAFRTRYLFAGNNYRRMVEPLDIAEFYREGKRDYLKNGRSQHYIQLEDWHKQKLLKEAIGGVSTQSSSTIDSRKHKVAEILTEDSCFWAHVEEALIDCNLIKNGEDIESARNRLNDFEEYVMKEIKNYAVSLEIFLGGSSFMQWWKEYKDIIEGTTHSSELTNFLKNDIHNKYANGAW